MNFLDFIEEELQEKLDPFVLFDEISTLTSKPQRLIITAFLKKFEPLSFYDSSSYRLYTYDSIKGLSEIDSLQDKNNCTDFLKMIVDGYDRVIFCDDYDVTKEYWGLEHKESGFDYKDSFGRYIPQTPFYFKRSDIKSFLEYSEIPLPPCITKDVTIIQIDDGIKETAIHSENKSNQDNIIPLPIELVPYSSRITINSWEASCIIVYNKPDASEHDELVNSYRLSILNAVKNGFLSSANVSYDRNGDIFYAELYKNEIGKWAKKHNYHWPFPIDEEVEEPISNNGELQQRIKQLEKELTEQTKINSESVYISPLNIADTDNLEAENNQLKIDNKNLTEQLNQAKKEIEELTKLIESNNIVELTEEYLKLRERNNYHSLIGGLLFLLLKDSDRNLNQNTVIVSLQEKFKGEPFSDRSLQDKFANAKRQLLSNHPNIKFD